MFKIYLLILTLLFLSACLHTNNFKEVEVVSVYAGDTLKVNLQCKKAIFCKGISVRVKGIDTPEIKTKNIKEKALTAKNFTNEFLSDGKIILRNCIRDKYFRLLCDVFIKQGKKRKELGRRTFIIGTGCKI